MKFIRFVGSNGETIHIDLKSVIAVRTLAGETQVHLCGGQTVNLQGHARIRFTEVFNGHVHDEAASRGYSGVSATAGASN